MDDKIKPVSASEEKSIVKEGGKVFEKKEIDVEGKIAEQQAIIASLQEQIVRAENTIAELQAI